MLTIHASHRRDKSWARVAQPNSCHLFFQPMINRIATAHYGTTHNVKDLVVCAAVCAEAKNIWTVKKKKKTERGIIGWWEKKNIAQTVRWWMCAVAWRWKRQQSKPHFFAPWRQDMPCACTHLIRLMSFARKPGFHLLPVLHFLSDLSFHLKRRSLWVSFHFLTFNSFSKTVDYSSNICFLDATHFLTWNFYPPFWIPTEKHMPNTTWMELRDESKREKRGGVELRTKEDEMYNGKQITYSIGMRHYSNYAQVGFRLFGSWHNFSFIFRTFHPCRRLFIYFFEFDSSQRASKPTVMIWERYLFRARKSHKSIKNIWLLKKKKKTASFSLTFTCVFDT